MADNKFVTLEALKSTTVRLQQEWLKSISKSGHASFQKVDAVPKVDAAQENIEYLYKSYHALGGNGTGTELYTRAKSLPLHAD